MPSNGWHRVQLRVQHSPNVPRHEREPRRSPPSLKQCCLSRLVLFTPSLRSNLRPPSLSAIYLTPPAHLPKPFLDRDPSASPPFHWLHVRPDNRVRPLNADALDRPELFKRQVLAIPFHIDHDLPHSG